MKEDPLAHASQKQLHRLDQQLEAWSLLVQGACTWEQAQALTCPTCGAPILTSFDPEGKIVIFQCITEAFHLPIRYHRVTALPDWWKRAVYPDRWRSQR